MQEILDASMYFLLSMIVFALGAITPLIKKNENVVMGGYFGEKNKEEST